MLRLLTLLGSLVILACSDRAGSDAAAPAAPHADSAIYAILLDSLLPGHQPAFAIRTFDTVAVTQSELADMAAWVKKELPTVDRAMVLALRSGAPGNLESRIPNAVGVTWIDTVPDQPAPTNTRPQRPIIWMSRVSYSADFAHALVYAGMRCGGLCGHASFYAFDRSPSGEWRLTGEQVHIIS